MQGWMSFRSPVRDLDDAEILERSRGALAEEALGHRNRDTQVGAFRMLEGERVEQAEQAVADDERIEVVLEWFARAVRRVDARERLSLHIERHSHVVDRGEQRSIEKVFH